MSQNVLIVVRLLSISFYLEIKWIPTKSNKTGTQGKMTDTQLLEELGFDPFGDTAQEEFERRVMELEQQSLENPEIDWAVKYLELKQ